MQWLQSLVYCKWNNTTVLCKRRHLVPFQMPSSIHDILHGHNKRPKTNLFPYTLTAGLTGISYNLLQLLTHRLLIPFKMPKVSNWTPVNDPDAWVSCRCCATSALAVQTSQISMAFYLKIKHSINELPVTTLNIIPVWGWPPAYRTFVQCLQLAVF